MEKRGGRPRKLTLETAKHITREYMRQAGVTEIKPSKLAEWVNQNMSERIGFTVNYLDFRRNDDIREFIDELNKKIKDRILGNDGEPIEAHGILIDIAKACKLDETDLRKYLAQMNGHISHDLEINRQALNQLRHAQERINELEDQNELLQLQIDQLQHTQQEFRDQVKKQNQELTGLKKNRRLYDKYIATYMYGPLVREHYIQLGLSEDDATDIDIPDSLRALPAADCDISAAVMQFVKMHFEEETNDGAMSNVQENEIEEETIPIEKIDPNDVSVVTQAELDAYAEFEDL